MNNEENKTDSHPAEENVSAEETAKVPVESAETSAESTAEEPVALAEEAAEPAAEKKVEDKPVLSPEKAKKKKTDKIIRIAVLSLCVAVFLFSGYKIISEFADNANTEGAADDLIGIAGREDDENTETVDGSDDINVPAAPVTTPSVSTPESETTTPETTEPETTEPETTEPETTKPENTETETTKPEPTEPETTAPETTEPVTPPETTTPVVTEPEAYDDRTYEEEQQEQVEVEENTQYYVSRPSKDKDTVQTGIVIRPEDIKLSQVSYLKASNLKKLLSINPDTVGWLYFPGTKAEAKGTPIDTAIVQTTDNVFYLDHTFDKKENINGWIYADYRCNLDSVTSNYNTVLYGHARSYTMFGGLKDLNTAVDWYSNGNNHFIKINTFNDETVWQIFSWYETDIYYDYIKTEFDNSTEFIQFAYEVQEKNQMTGVFETFDFDENNRILTLSTCKGFDRAVRVAVHAVLVKRNPLN